MTKQEFPDDYPGRLISYDGPTSIRVDPDAGVYPDHETRERLLRIEAMLERLLALMVPDEEPA